MKNNEPKVQHKIGDAVITEEGAAQLASWQEFDNDTLDGAVCDLLKVVSFMACTASAYDFNEKDKTESMKHIIILSEMSKNIEVFKK